MFKLDWRHFDRYHIARDSATKEIFMWRLSDPWHYIAIKVPLFIIGETLGM